MSKNSKNSRKLREAKDWSSRRKAAWWRSGGGGPAKTQPKHGKVNRKPMFAGKPKEKKEES